LTTASQDLGDLEFDDVRVEPRAHRLLKAGVEVPVEPKAFAVLLALIARQGELVTRDALLDAVWGHRHVTPAVLNRVIAMLRRVIGDDADAPRVIQTVHGLGYRFSADLRRGAAPPTAIAPATDAVEIPASPHPQPVPSEVPPPRTPRPVVWLVLLAIVGMATWIVWPRGETPKIAPDAAPAARNEPAAAAPAIVVVLPLAVREAGESETALALGLAESLDEMLARLPDVRMIGRESAQIALDRAKTPRAAGELLQADFVLHGTLGVVSDGGIALDLELTRTRDGAPAWTSAFQQPRDQLFRILGPTLDGVQRILRPAAPAASDPLLKADESAQDLYWSARQALQSLTPGSVDRAVGLFERALDRDPTFALAYCGLSAGYRFQGMGGRLGVDEAAAKAQVAVARALEIDPKLMCAHLGSAYILTSQWRAPQAAPAVRRALDLAPGDAAALDLAGNVASYIGRPREALELHRRAMAADPLNPVRGVAVWYDLTMLGRMGDALAAIDRASEGNPAAGRMLVGSRARVFLASGRIADALDASRRSDASFYDRLLAATMYSQLGLHADAESILRDVVPTRANPPLYIDSRMTAFWAAGRTADAVAWIEGEGALSVQEPWLSTWRAQARALGGDREAALGDYDAALAADMDRRTIAYSWFTGRFGVGQLANWAALRESTARDSTGPASAYRELLQEMTDGGTATPAIDYYRAVESALAGDSDAADHSLERALASGWRDAIAFDTDLVWQRYADAPWLQRHRAATRDALAAERAKVEAAR
jgi:DNA-binding winged helix-turn-helix (wHTH) protein/tetratricopeptide (TPR) repeat protein